jgi:drug/metabolite transporter (DMT)-like permease
VTTSTGQQGRLITAVSTLIAAIFLFDVQGAMIKHMGEQYPIEQVVIFRNLFGIFPNLLVLLYAVGWKPGRATWRLHRWKLAVGRGLILICAQMSFYYSLTQLQLATATTLAFAGPLFVTLLSIPLLGHRVGWWRAASVVLGFTGVVMIMKPGSDAFNIVALLPIAAAFFYAITSLSSRFFDPQVPTALIGIYASVGAMCAGVLLLFIQGSWIAMDSLAVWMWFIAMGTVGGFAVLLFITAYRMADPSSLSPFEYFGIPFSFTLGWMFFDETPFDSLFPGVILIVAAGLSIMWRERQLTKTAQA